MKNKHRSKISNPAFAAANKRGFALLELIVVVGLLAVLLAAYLNFQHRSAQATARDTAKAEMLSDLKVLTRATQQYVKDNVSAWPEGSQTTITLAQLRTAGLIPTNFAARVYGADRTPFGAPYRIIAIRNTGEPGAKTLIGDAPTDLLAAYEGYGLDLTTAQGAAVKREIAGLLVAEGFPAASVASGGATATGGGSNSWTKNVSAWIGNGAWPTTQILLGFPDLEGSMPGGGDNPGEEVVKYEDCEVVRPTCSVSTFEPGCVGSVVEATCPVGKEEAGTYPHCGYRETIFSSTDVGSVTMGSWTAPPIPSRDDPNGAYDCCSNLCTQEGGIFFDRVNTYTYGVVTLNNVEIARDLCNVNFTRSQQCGNTGPAAVQSGTTAWPTGTRDKICCTVAD